MAVYIKIDYVRKQIELEIREHYGAGMEVAVESIHDVDDTEADLAQVTSLSSFEFLKKKEFVNIS